MVFVSITRLRIRSLRFLPAFVVRTFATLRQVRGADGFLGGSLLPDRRRVFWTMTLWRDQAAMRRYMTSGPHLAAMPRLLHWCDEASIVHWSQEDDAPPDWVEADRRMRGEGRPSKVRHPAPHHASLGYPPPRTSRAAPIVRT